MKKLDPNQGSQLAAEWLEDEMNKQLNVETDTSRKRLISTFYARQIKSMEALELIQADEPPKKQRLELAEQGRWLNILLHPAGHLLFPVIILVLAMFRLNIPTAIAAVLMLVRAVLLLLVRPDRKKEPETPPVSTPYVDDEDLTGFLRDLRNAISIDVDSLMSQFATTGIKEQKGVASDLVTVYTSLYEASVDAPDNDDLSYPLSVLKTCLYRVGMEVVHYSPENALLFDMMDVDYPSQERTPAIRSREDGILIRKGLYLNEKK